MSNTMFVITDFMLANIVRLDLNHIADYLSYKEQFQSILQHPWVISNESRKRKLQSIIFLNYKIKFIEMIQLLWQIYRKSGRDELNIDPEIQILHRRVWPREVQLQMNELQPLLFPEICSLTCAPFTMPYPRNTHVYLGFIHSCLDALEKKRANYQTTLLAEIRSVSNYKKQFKKQIDDYITKELLPIRIEIDCQIGRVYHDFKDEIHRRQLAEEILHDKQIALVERICQLKFEQETIKSQINLYHYMQLNPRSGDFVKLSPLLNCTRNPNLRQELYQQYKIWKENMGQKTNMDHLIEGLEMKQEDLQIKINQITGLFWQRHRSLPHEPQNIRIIRQGIEQRLSNITNRMTCIEGYKRRFLQIQHP